MVAPENREAASIPAAGRGFTVAASPFNGIKLELAVVLCLNLVLWLVGGRLMGGGLVELLLLAAGGLGGMAWLMFRTRRVLARHLANTATAGADGWPGLR